MDLHSQRAQNFNDQRRHGHSGQQRGQVVDAMTGATVNVDPGGTLEADVIARGSGTLSTAAETLELRLRGGWAFGQNHSVNFALERQAIDYAQGQCQG